MTPMRSHWKAREPAAIPDRLTAGQCLQPKTTEDATAPGHAHTHAHGLAHDHQTDTTHTPDTPMSGEDNAHDIATKDPLPTLTQSQTTDTQLTQISK